MGLVKLPQPVLLSGQGLVELTDGTRLPIASPYIGLPPQSIKRVVLDEGARYIFSVENLTTFHELALGKAGSVCGLLMYTAGAIPISSKGVSAGHGRIPVFAYPKGSNVPTDNAEGKMLMRILFSSCADNFEIFMSDLLYEIYLAKPETLEIERHQ